MFAVDAGSRGFDSHRGTCPNVFFRSNRPGYPHPVCSELENSGIRVAVSDCSVTERRRWHPPYQTGKTIHVQANTLQIWWGRTHGAGCARSWFRTAEPLEERSLRELDYTHTNTVKGCFVLLFLPSLWTIPKHTLQTVSPSEYHLKKLTPRLLTICTQRRNLPKSTYLGLLAGTVCCFFTSTVNSYGHVGVVS